jgi:hypothetical protein
MVIKADRKTKAQAVMGIAQVVETAYDEQASRKCFCLLSQSTCAASEPAKAQPEGGIEPLDVGGIDDTHCLLGQLTQVVHLMGTSLNNAAYNFQAGR